MNNMESSPVCLIVSDNMVEAADIADIIQSERGFAARVIKSYEALDAALRDEALNPQFAFVSDDIDGNAMAVAERLMARGTQVVVLNGKANVFPDGLQVIARPFSTRDLILALNGFV